MFQTETMETLPPRRLSVCFVVRKPDRFESCFALMHGCFPLQHHYFGIRHQHQPFKSNVFPLLCNYYMHACAEGTHLLLFVSLLWWWWSASVGLRGVYVSVCLCGFLITINVL